VVPQLDLPPASRRTAAFFGVAWVVVIAAAAALTQISSGFWVKLWTGLLTTAGSVLFAASGLGLVLDYRRRTRWQRLTKELRLAAINSVAADYATLLRVHDAVLRPILNAVGFEDYYFLAHRVATVPMRPSIDGLTAIYDTQLRDVLSLASLAAGGSSDEHQLVLLNLSPEEFVEAIRRAINFADPFPSAPLVAMDRLQASINNLCEIFGDAELSFHLLNAISTLRVMFLNFDRTAKFKAAVTKAEIDRLATLPVEDIPDQEITRHERELPTVAAVLLAQFAVAIVATWRVIGAVLTREFLIIGGRGSRTHQLRKTLAMDPSLAARIKEFESSTETHLDSIMSKQSADNGDDGVLRTLINRDSRLAAVVFRENLER